MADLDLVTQRQTLQHACTVSQTAALAADGASLLLPLALALKEPILNLKDKVVKRLKEQADKLLATFNEKISDYKDKIVEALSNVMASVKLPPFATGTQAEAVSGGRRLATTANRSIARRLSESGEPGFPFDSIEDSGQLITQMVDLGLEKVDDLVDHMVFMQIKS